MRLCLLVALLCGCGGDRRVPQQDEPDEPERETPERFEALRSQPVELGAAVSVEGAPLDAQLAALLTIDLDADGDRDALGVEVHEGSVGIHVAHRDEGAFRSRRVGMLEIEEGCSIETSALETLSPRHAFGTARITCEEQEAWRAWWVLTLGASPRLQETLSLRGGGSLQLHLEDLDDDDHVDLRAEIDLGQGAINLRWFDRPSGLARESGEPAATLEAMENATPMIAALCAGAEPRLRLGRSEWGLECPDALTGRARDARALELIASGNLRAALDAMPPDPSEALRTALSEAATTVRARTVTRWTEPANTSTRHVMLAFRGDDLIVRGVEAQLYRAPDPGSLQPSAPIPADAHPAPVSDPRDAFFVQSLHRDCNGLELRLLPRAQLGASAFAAPRAVRAFDAPIEGCTATPDDEWRALGWAPQGVVVASLNSRRTIPLTIDALPLGNALELPDETLPPAPLVGGRITPDGSVWIWETPHGVLRVGERDELWRTTDWQSAPVEAAAISDEGDAIAILQAGIVSLLERDPS